MAKHPNPVTTYGTNFREGIVNSSDPIIRQMSSKYEQHANFDEAFANLTAGTHIMLESQTGSQYNIRKMFTNE